MSTLSVKDPIEKIIVSFDFSALTTSALSNPSISIARRKGEGKSDPTAMLVGLPSVSGSIVGQVIEAGDEGDDYTIRCVCDAGSERLVVAALLPVRAFDGR